MRYLQQFLVVILLIITTATAADAVQTSRPSPVDSRLHFLTYHPDGIHKYTGYLDYQASIVFSPEETIKTISMGDTSKWQMVPTGNRLFLKPLFKDAVTNMLLMTNKRLYHFILDAAEVGPKGINDPNLIFETTFIYPDNNFTAVRKYGSSKKPDLSEPEKYHFNYSLSGSHYISPIRVFDDGAFTYFEFSKLNAEIPAFFLVDSQGKEALINYRVIDNYIVIERVGSQFTLRHGADVVCVFNESSPLLKRKTKKI